MGDIADENDEIYILQSRPITTVDRNELFVGISPQAKKEFVELLRKTIQISKRSRYT